jgi:hypothetical protein
MANSNLNSKMKEIRRREKAQRKREARFARQQAKRNHEKADAPPAEKLDDAVTFIAKHLASR